MVVGVLMLFRRIHLSRGAAECIEFKTYTGRIGAGNNATISIQPFTVVAD
jgi:hypothetical protein